MSMRKFLSVILMSGLAVMLLWGSASALTIRLTSGGSVAEIADGGAGDLNPADGAVTFIGSIDVWSINVSTGLSKPAVGTPPFSVEMDLNSVNTSNSDGGTLKIVLSDTGFTSNLPDPFPFVASIGGTTDGTLDFYETYIDYDDVLFSQGSQIASLGPFSGPAYSGTATGSVAADPDVFALTQVVQFTHSGSGVTSFDANLATAPVPEPATGLLYVLGAIGIAGIRRKKFKK